MTQTCTIPALPGNRSRELDRNPDRGFRLEVHFYDIKPILAAPDRKAFVKESVLAEVAECAPLPITIAQNYLYLTEYIDRDIPEDTLSAFREVFEAYRELGIKILQRFAYQYHDGSRGASTERILSHIRQLKPLIWEYRDIIYVFQTGFVGLWGEWHDDEPRVDREQVLHAVAEELVPPETYMQLRLPDYKNILPPTHPAYAKIGFNNDCFFGKIDTDLEPIGSGGLDPWKPQWKQWNIQCPFAPCDAELYWSSWNFPNDFYCDGYAGILAMKEHRLTTFSAKHGWGDVKPNEVPASPRPQSTMERWEQLPITPDRLAEHGILADPEWFTDEQGNVLARNVLEFVRDHLGYRLIAKEVSVTRDGAHGPDLAVRLSLENRGFSAPFNLHGEFALLDGSGKVLSRFPIRGIEGWHPVSPTDPAASDPMEHTVYGALRVPDGYAGDLSLGIRLESTNGAPALFANDIPAAGGYRLLAKLN